MGWDLLFDKFSFLYLNLAKNRCEKKFLNKNTFACSKTLNFFETIISLIQDYIKYKTLFYCVVFDEYKNNRKK